MAEIAITIGENSFSTPFMVGSSDLINTCEQAEKVVQCGNGLIGAIVWKSTTLLPREGYQEPRICWFKDGFLVASGMRNLGISRTIEEIRKFKEKYPEQPVILSLASVGCDNPIIEFAEMTKQIRDIPITGVELNLSCPHQVEGERFKTTELLAQNKATVKNIVSKVANLLKGTKKIVIVKLTGWNTNIAEMAKIAQQSGADAITVSNIFPGIGYYTGLEEYGNQFSYQVGDPLVGNQKGGYTGVAMLPATLLIVNTVKHAVTIPVIATGGCMSSNDAMMQAFLAGATAIASATFYYERNGETSRDFSSDLQERKNVLETFVQNKKWFYYFS